ncbi:MAG: dihydropteroate synthase, partial [Oscillospiraceae bacterium]
NLPVFVKPNAGLPNLKTGGYDLNPETFAEILKDYISLGVFAVGGCCGTTPDFICETKKVFEKYKPFKREQHFRAAICSGTKYLPLENICVIGERINPTGKKIFREALKNNDMDYILKQAVDQQEAGADILDVNVGTPGIDEPQMMINVVTNLQSVTDLPLQIDSSDPIAVEKALRIYNGKAIVNSVNGEKAVLDKLLPIVKKYGAAVVGLTLDENGIPPKAEERFAIAKHILETALNYGIAKENVLIDCLTLTASAQQAEVAETLKAVRLVKQNLGLKTVLGVSNISFGLPNRELLNHSFLLLAMGEGLDLPILNPNIDSMMSAVRAYRVLYNIDKQSSQYIDAYKDYTPTEQKIQKTSTGTAQDNVQNVTDAIKKGLKKQSADETLKLLSTYEPLQIVNEFLIPALDEVGLQFEKGKLFLPQLLQAADAAGAAFDIIKAQMIKDNTVQTKKETIILATVKGDIHDIGKNIVKVIMENYGYKILDLGKDTPVQTVVDAIIETKAPLVGLSALMTTTLKSMQETINAIKLAKLPCKIMVGGAVLTEEYALEMGADFYAKDAKQSVDIAKKIIG